MNTNQLASLWRDLLSDLRDPGLMWQLGVLFLCLGAAFVLARILRSAIGARDVNYRVVRWGVESFSYVMFPVFAWILFAIARPLLANWHHTNLIRVAIPLAASAALIRLAFYLLRRVFAKRGPAGSGLLIFEKVFATLVWCGVALYITGLWPEVLERLDDITLPMGRNKISVLTILQGVGSVVVTLLLALWAGALLEERLMRFDSVHSSLRVVLGRTVRALLIVVAVLLSLSLVGIDLTVLSVFGGALGVGIGLGLQKLVSSYVSGFVILLERSMTIGDLVTVDKYSGKVTFINTRYTVLRTPEGVESVIPNEMLVSSAVQNFSYSSRTMRLTTQLTVAYGADVEMLLPELEAAAAGIERVLADPGPAAFLLRFGADGMELEVGYSISDPENARSQVISNVNRALWRLLQDKQVAIATPQRQVRVVNDAGLPFVQ